MDFDTLYKQVMNVDKAIQYAVIMSKVGERICGGYKEEVKPVFTDDELKMVHFYAGQRWGTRKNIEHRIGKNKYAMAEYEKMKRISFPINDDYLLMIHTDVENNHQEIIIKILDLIKNIPNKTHSQNQFGFISIVASFPIITVFC